MNEQPAKLRSLYGSIACISLLLGAFMSQACEAFECGYGGPGCSAPLMAGQCDDVLVVGQEYIFIFGYGSDTGISEATVTSVQSAEPHILLAGATPGSPDVPYETGPTGPFDLNNGAGDGGISLKPLLPGKVEVTIALQGWEQDTKLTFQIVNESNAPEGFAPMTAQERLAKCIEKATSTASP
jgi:hypothetical protein